MAEPESPTPPDAPSVEELRRAMKAFKKRLKLARLDDESSLTRSPMSGGKASSIVAIMPPNQYPKAIWDELVRLERLVYAGQGMYQMPDRKDD